MCYYKSLLTEWHTDPMSPPQWESIIRHVLDFTILGRIRIPYKKRQSASCSFPHIYIYLPKYQYIDTYNGSLKHLALYTKQQFTKIFFFLYNKSRAVDYNLITNYHIHIYIYTKIRDFYGNNAILYRLYIIALCNPVKEFVGLL